MEKDNLVSKCCFSTLVSLLSLKQTYFYNDLKAIRRTINSTSIPSSLGVVQHNIFRSFIYLYTLKVVLCQRMSFQLKGVRGFPPPSPGDTTAAGWGSPAGATCSHHDLRTLRFAGFFFLFRDPAPILKLHGKVGNVKV